jgi:hypothetical protein
VRWLTEGKKDFFTALAPRRNELPRSPPSLGARVR